ncbi:MAG: hypothetical protein KKB70_08550 [Proteobacteria bacterium]|nr:hypothetical protein [Pseudomonadota bacterium]
MQSRLHVMANLLLGFGQHDEIRTKMFLGNRDYIGMSDVGKAFGCLRAAVAGKVFDTKKHPDLATIKTLLEGDETTAEKGIKTYYEEILPLHRGHWQEPGIASALSASGAPAIEQLEIKHTFKGVPIQAHLDFTLIGPDRVRVLESKSTAILPSEPYGEWEAQVFGQVGLIHDMWNEPAFTVKDDDGNITCENFTFPQVVKQLFGFDYPDTPLPIDGFVLAISMRGIEVFGPYIPKKLETQLVLLKSEELWNTAQMVKNGQLDIDDVRTAIGFYPLCDYCDASKGCPKFNVEANAPEFEEVIIDIKELKERVKVLEVEIDEKEKTLMEGYNQHKLPGGYIEAGEFEFRAGTVKSERLNKDELRRTLVGLGWKEEEITGLLEESSVSSEFTRLYIRKPKKPTKKKAA